MTKKSKEINYETFDWTCYNCKTLNIETHISSKIVNETIKLMCSYCGQLRPIKLVDLPEAVMVVDWIGSKCPQCIERINCFNEENKIFKQRTKLINKLSFCEDYIVDASRLQTDNRQICHEEVTFDDLFNKGQFPLDLEEETKLI